MGKELEIKKLNTIMLADKRLNFFNTNLVLGEGSLDSFLFFIGEAPGKREDELKAPFVGRSGEFLNKSMENSKSGKKRTKIYYAHPYSAWERGTNENINRMIRRFIPKGANIDEWSEKDIARIERIINNYPRKILGGLSAQTVFTNELYINTKLFLKSATI